MRLLNTGAGKDGESGGRIGRAAALSRVGISNDAYPGRNGSSLAHLGRSWSEAFARGHRKRFMKPTLHAWKTVGGRNAASETLARARRAHNENTWVGHGYAQTSVEMEPNGEEPFQHA